MLKTILSIAGKTGILINMIFSGKNMLDCVETVERG